MAAGGARGHSGRSLEPVSKGSTAGSEQATEPRGGAGAWAGEAEAGGVEAAAVHGSRSKGARRPGCSGRSSSTRRPVSRRRRVGEAPVRRCSVAAGARLAESGGAWTVVQ